MLDQVPQNGIVHPKVSMRQEISQPGHTPPINVGVLLPKRLRDMFGSLADQFEISKNGIVGPFIRNERIEVHALCVEKDLGRAGGDVLKVERYLTRHGRRPVLFRSAESVSELDE